VGVLVDGVTGFGRAIMRGFMRYANLQRRWIIHEEMRHLMDVPPDWPECDGTIIAGVGAGPAFEHAFEHSRFTIRCSGSADPAISPVVCLDDYAVGVVAAQHLMDCRLEHFAFFGLEPDSPLCANRFRGFSETLAERGHSVHEAGLGWTTSIEWKGNRDEQKLLAWLDSLPKPVGLLAIDDSAAHDIAALCLKADIAVPERIAIVGVNNDDLLCESAWPPITSVNCDYSRVGYMAANMMDRLLQGQKLKANDRLIRLPPLGVVRRQSSDILAVDNHDLADAIRYIREHACEPCTVGDILRHVPVGRRWLERQFVRTLGRNPHDEIMRVRIDTAKRLLLEPGLTLTDIAERCGFAVQQNFGRAFAQITGQTPGAYRRAAKRGSGEN
jgi:LacI family transcriptional regulator